MATMRQVDTRFWKDNWIRKINSLDRYAFLYLLTNDNCSWCGIYELPLSVMAFETGIDERDLENSILPRLEEKVLYVEGWIFIKNFTKYHDTGSPNSKKGIENALKEVPENILAKINEKTNRSEPLATVGNCRHTSSSSSSSSSSFNTTNVVGAKAPSKRRTDIDFVLEGIKKIVKILDGTQKEQRFTVKNFIESKAPEILRQSGNLNPTTEQIHNAIFRIFQLAQNDSFHSKNCTSVKYVYNKAGAIVMSSKQTNNKPKIEKYDPNANYA